MEARPERPSGTVTFLFSDIEGSTRLLQRLGALYGGALAEHQRLLREAFAAHGGHEIDTQGDSFFVAFRRAKDAVAAAVDAQHALADYDWPEGAEVRVRMGIHTGEPVAGEGRYVGLGVHRAARIGAAAVGGQVLVSESTRALLRDDPLPDIALRDLGLHQLKDIDEPERLFELNGPGLVTADLAGPAGRVSRKRLVVGAALVTVAVAAALGTFLSRGGGTAKASTVAPNEVGVIDATSGSISGSVPVGSAPNGVAVGDKAVWVANTDDNSITRVDPNTKTVRQTIPVGGSPSGVAVSPGSVWVANASDGTVSRIDSSANSVVQTLNVGNGPEGIAYDAGKIWVANSADGTVTEIDAKRDRVERTLPGAVGVAALTAAFGHVWTVSPASGKVVALDPKGGSANVGVGVDPDAVAAAAGAIWVANRHDGTVSRVDPRTASVTQVIQVGHEPAAVVGDSSAVWVANSGDSTLSKIDPATNTVVKTFSLANPPQGLALNGSDLYVSVRSNGLANRGGTLRVAEPTGPDSDDPAYAFAPTSWAILSLTNDGLVGFRRVGGPEGTELVPDLATTLPAPTDGGRTYAFTLRSGIRYSNGRLVEPEDVKAGIERTLATKPASDLRDYYTSDIVGASRCTPGKPCHLAAGIVTNRLARTITFHLRAPDPDFLTRLALPTADAVPPGTAAGKTPVPATGPYKIVTFQQKQRLVRLVRNRYFHEWSHDAQPSGFPAAINLTWSPDVAPAEADASLTKAVESGKSDLAVFPLSPPVPRRMLDDLATRYPSQLRFDLEQATWYFFLNTRVAPFDDLRVRQAVQEAFDRGAFGRLLTREYTPTCNILPPGYAGYEHGCPYKGSEESRLAKAKALVRASGTTGTRVVVWTPAPLAFEGRYMISLLDSLGFRANPHTVSPVDIGQYFGAILSPKSRIQTGYVGWNANYPSSLGFFRDQFGCASHYVTGFCDHHIDAEFRHAAQLQVLDPPAATLLWQKIGRQLLALAPMIPAYNGREVAFVGKHVGNFQYNPQWGVLLDQLWVK
jgi:YVTN family beta-propeller protein